MRSDKQEEEYGRLLDITVNNRLLFPKREQLVAFFGKKELEERPLSSIYKDSFQRKAVFEALSRDTYDITDGIVDLRNIISQYREASNWYQKHYKKSYFRDKSNQCIVDLLNIICIDDGETDSVGKLSSPVIKAIKELYDKHINVAIVLLLLLGILPVMGKKGDNEDILNDFRTLLSFFKNSPFADYLPLDIYKNSVRKANSTDNDPNVQLHKTIPLLNRTTLMKFAEEITNYIYTTFHLEVLLKAVKHNVGLIANPDIDGLWTYGKGNDFRYVTITSANTNYNLSINEIEGKKIHFHKKELYLFQLKRSLHEVFVFSSKDKKKLIGQYTGYMTGEGYLYNLIDLQWKDKKAPKLKNDYVELFCHVVKNNGGEDQLHISIVYPDMGIHTLTLYRVAKDSDIIHADKALPHICVDSAWYFIYYSVMAITPKWLYVGRFRQEDEGKKRIDFDELEGFYKVDRYLNEDTCHIHSLDSHFGVMTVYHRNSESGEIEKKEFICSPETGDFIDVTDDEKRKENNITVVQSID